MMKRELQRIETTLNQLDTQLDAPKQIDTPKQTEQSNAIATAQSYSFDLGKSPAQKRVGSTEVIQPFPVPSEPSQPASLQTTHSTASVQASIQSFKVGTASTEPAETVQPFPVQASCPKIPSLPKLKPTSFSNHRHVTNPNLAVGLLKEIEEVAIAWQVELQQVLLQIQTIYLEGPIVDGWLESYRSDGQPDVSPSDSATLRHAEVDALMKYVKDLYDAQPTAQAGDVIVQQALETPRTDYRLCGLDADGQLWFRPCPAEQVPYVSLAIARYQKLRQLLARQQSLEARLSQLAETLVVLHGQIQEPQWGIAKE